MTTENKPRDNNMVFDEKLFENQHFNQAVLEARNYQDREDSCERDHIYFLQHWATVARWQFDQDLKALEAEREKVRKLEEQLEFTKQYLNPVNTSFRTMMDNFRGLTDSQKEKIINLSQSLLAIKEIEEA